jgi:hypothetical protein
LLRRLGFAASAASIAACRRAMAGENTIAAAISGVSHAACRK